MESFGDRLRFIRKKNNLTQKKLEEKSSIEAKIISKLERNSIQPSDDQLHNLCTALGVKYNYLAKGEFEIPEENLTKYYAETSRYIWNVIKNSDIQDMSIGEETLTEVALLRLKKFIGNSLQILKFSRSKENENGADWEWIVIQGDKWLGFRIQAKRLFNLEGYSEYTHIHHKLEEKNSTQIEQLISNARQKKFIPLYSFYNFLPEEHLDDLIPKKSIKDAIRSKDDLFKGSLELDLSLMGWSICYANHLVPTTENMSKDFRTISAKCKNISAFIGRDLQEIVNEYNRLFGDENGDGGVETDNPSPNNEGGSGAAIEENKIELSPLSELPEYVKHRLSEVGFAFGDYNDTPRFNEVHRVVVSVMSPHPHTTLLFNEAEADPSPEQIKPEKEYQELESNGLKELVTS